MFYKIAKALSKVTIAFGFVCMAGGCSVEQHGFKYLRSEEPSKMSYLVTFHQFQFILYHFLSGHCGTFSKFIM